MNILLTGIDGYVGWPTALKLSREFPKARIIGVDNLGRRKWVEESGCVSAVPVQTMHDRLRAAVEYGFDNISFIEGDLVDQSFVKRLFDIYSFDVVLHLAAQPSAPYSHLSGERASFTQHNNCQATRNLLWGIKEAGLSKGCKFIETTTTGVYGAPGFSIPEGFVTAENKGKTDLIPFAGMAGSWYHMSKSNDANNLWLANRLWGLGVTDLRTSIVYGASTEETRLDSRLATRFDFDFNFGIVVNRFCAMAMTGHPIMVYGKGGQKKPFISLEDCAQSNVNAVKLKRTRKFIVYNQTTETVGIGEMAGMIKEEAAELGVEVKIEHIKNPRVEDEDHKMEIDTDLFRALLPQPRTMFRQGVADILRSIEPHVDVLTRYKDRFMGG